MKKTILFLVAVMAAAVCSINAQTLSETQMQNARATGYAIVASRNPGVPFSIYMIQWDGVNTLEHNANRINASWHAQAVVKGNYFTQDFDGNNFSDYSSVILSQEEFDLYKDKGTQWWIVCSTLPSFSDGRNSLSGIEGSIRIRNGHSVLFDRGNGDYSTTIDAYGYTSSGYAANSTNNYWLRLASKGGTHIVLNTDGGVGSSENNYDHFTIWQGKVDGDRLFALTNTGNTYIKGSLAIGTTTTNGYKLAVNGTIGAREIVVNTDTWADFVFNSDYRLMPLAEVESFIQANNHLPDVPSETEVKANGINVAEMNAKLLQKIEELTLYMIELSKENKEMKKEIEILKKK